MYQSNTFYTTAQFAKLHGINKRTLHYYDDIGLFSPKHKGDNQYRYYTESQSIELQFILMLKDLHMRLDEIADYLKHPSSEGFQVIANDKITMIDQQIQQLKQTKAILEKRLEMLEISDNIHDKEIRIEHHKKEYILTTPCTFHDDQLDMIAKKLLELNISDSSQIGYGSYISLDKIRNNNFSEYDGLYLPVKGNIKSKTLMIRPEGMYVCAYIKGDWNRIPGFYQDILAYAKTNHIKLGTYAFETGMNDFAIETMEDYVTEISIHMED